MLPTTYQAVMARVMDGITMILIPGEVAGEPMVGVMGYRLLVDGIPIESEEVSDRDRLAAIIQTTRMTAEEFKELGLEIRE